MEILKDKKLLVGGLAVISGIALVSYLLKPKAPRRNSEGFFNAQGRKNITEQEIPSFFKRRIFTTNNGITKNYCANFFIQPNIVGSIQYLKQPILVLNGIEVPVSNPEVITYNEFLKAYRKFSTC